MLKSTCTARNKGAAATCEGAELMLHCWAAQQSRKLEIITEAVKAKDVRIRTVIARERAEATCALIDVH